MLSKPSTCLGCPLMDDGDGFMSPQLGGVAPGGYQVALLGEALGKEEAETGLPFIGRSGFKLTRLIEFAGLDRSKFSILNSVWCRPPDNKLEGTPYEIPSVAHCKQAHWGHLLAGHRVIVPMGNVPLHALTGRKGILTQRGYIQAGEGYHILPTVHPSFIQRGQSKYSAALIHDLQRSVELARDGIQAESLDYVLDPLPLRAYEWAKEYRVKLAQGLAPYLAFDIETPGKAEDEGDLDPDDDPTYMIWRIGFCYESGSALSIPWEPSYMPAIKLLMESEGEKVVWNAGFDCPRIRHNGVQINGLIHDGMVAWHILHSDLPKGLGFVATFTCPHQPAWKHLSHARPAFYNATDADVELRSMQVIEQELKRADLWGVYQRDVLDLDPILRYMHDVGMPIDQEVRLDRAIRLADAQTKVMGELSQLIPEEARKIEKVFVNTPKSLEGLKVRPSSRHILCCAVCGVEKPRKDHFKAYKRKLNPCVAAGTREVEIHVAEYYRLADFKPSREQLIRYQQVKGRRIPMTRDKKSGKMRPSMDEKALKGLIITYPSDSIYGMILEYRSLDKLGGTYLGRPIWADQEEVEIGADH